jgi:hypothetical protein
MGAWGKAQVMSVLAGVDADADAAWTAAAKAAAVARDFRGK